MAKANGTTPETGVCSKEAGERDVDGPAGGKTRANATIVAFQDETWLRDAGVEPTRQRLVISGFLRRARLAHFTTAQVYMMLWRSGLRQSFGTVGNTLSSLTQAGLIRRIDVGHKTFYCMKVGSHHHFFDEDTGEISATPDGQPRLIDLPDPPEGKVISTVDVIVRVRKA